MARPTEALLEVEGDSIRPLSVSDLTLMQRLAATIPAEVFQLPGTAAELAVFIESVGRRTWSMPMVSVHSGGSAGLCLLSLGQPKNLNAYLVALFDAPPSS